MDQNSCKCNSFYRISLAQEKIKFGIQSTVLLNAYGFRTTVKWKKS